MAPTCIFSGEHIKADDLGSRIEAKERRCEGVTTDIGVIRAEAMAIYDLARHAARRQIAAELGLQWFNHLPKGCVRKLTKQFALDAVRALKD